MEQATQLSPVTPTLFGVAQAIAEGKPRAAERALARLLSSLYGRDDSLADQLRVFGAGMSGALSDAARREANLYLQHPEVSQLALFDLLASRVPHVSLARDVGTAMLARLCAGQRQVTLIDVGIGMGVQVAALLRHLAKLPSRVEQVHVVGIECQQSSLEAAGRLLASAAAEAGIALQWTPLLSCVEDLSEVQWERLSRLPGPKIAMSSFAMHHVGRFGELEARDLVLSRLHRLGLTGLLLAEPDSDHLNDDYQARFAAAWRHFGLVFRMLDRLELSGRELSALKASLFGREIADILGTVQGPRAERHEPLQTWWERLHGAGFVPLRGLGPEAAISRHPVSAVDRGDHVALEYEGTRLVSLILARPAYG